MSIQRLLILVFFMAIARFAQAQTFSATVNQSIPDDNSVVSFPLVVAGLPNVIDSAFGLESACLNMTHTYCSDMEVILQSPDGTQVLLFSGIGGGDDDFLGTCLGDTGISVTQGSAPFNGNFMSQGPMGNINNGQNPNGVWLLLCRDMAGADIGFLQDWRITFGSNPAMPFIFASSNLPIVILSTVGTPIGDDPKVPVDMKIIDNGPGLRNVVNDSIYAFQGRIMAEWQGFTGPMYPKKNYDFEVVDALGNDLDTVLLGMPRESDWILKAEYLDHSLLKNTIAYEMARRMGRYAPRTRACEVILDGQYIGYYTLTEKVKKGPDRVDIAGMSPTDTSGADLTGGYIFEMNINGEPGDWNSNYAPINNATCSLPVEFKHVYPKSTEILPVQRDYLVDYVSRFENILNGPQFMDVDSGYRSVINVSSFIDFLIVNEFSVNYDSYGRSTYLYKEKVTDGGKLKIGPPWDYDRALDWDYPGNTSGWVWQITHPYWPFPFWWSKLYTDPDYRKQLACRWEMLRQDVLSDQSFTQFIDSSANRLSEAAERNFRVWNDLGGQTYGVQIDSLKQFLLRRLDWIDQELSVENVSSPVVYLPADSVFCRGSVYDASFNGMNYTYNWQPGPDTSIVTWTVPGDYRLVVTDEYGCYTTREMSVGISVPDASFSMMPSASPFAWDFVPADPLGTSYSWTFGDGNSSQSISPSHLYAQAGTYPVGLVFSDSLGCTASTMDTLWVTGVQVNPVQSGILSISPIPFQDFLMVEMGQPLKKAGCLSLWDANGRLIQQMAVEAGFRSIELRTEDLPDGVYLVSLQTDVNVFSRKVIKR